MYQDIDIYLLKLGYFESVILRQLKSEKKGKKSNLTHRHDGNYQIK